jgi:hypothetical protein
LFALAQAGFDKNVYTGKPIRKPLESWHINANDTIDFIFKALVPSWTPGLDIRESPVRGGYSFNKLVAALRKKGDWAGRVRPLSWTISDVVFGLKAYPTSPQERLFFESLNTEKAIRERIGNARRIIGHQGISPEEKAREKMRLAKDLERAIRRLAEVRGD